MSSASSHQSFVHDGVCYEEVYSSGHEDHDSQSEERSPSTSSPSSRIEGLEVSDEEGSNDGPDNDDLLIQSVVGPNGLRQFVMLPEWSVNHFTSSIKEKHFKTFRAYKFLIYNYVLCWLYFMTKTVVIALILFLVFCGILLYWV